MKIIEKIKIFFHLKKENDRLREELQSARQRVLELKFQVGDPRLVVEKIFGRGIKWFNAMEMSTQERQQYFDEAQTILNSRVFNNIFNLVAARITQENVRQYNPLSNINPSRDTQMQLNGMELLKEELEDISDPSKEPKPDTIIDEEDYQ